MEITDCDLIQSKPGSCWVKACGKRLPKRRRKWCSEDHAELYWRNHSWNSVRYTAIRRDGFRCVRCGRMAPQRYDYFEVNHIEPLGDGGHHAMDCRHHLDGVETLCHECHVFVTKVQRSDRWLTEHQGSKCEWPRGTLRMT